MRAAPVTQRLQVRFAGISDDDTRSNAGVKGLFEADETGRLPGSKWQRFTRLPAYTSLGYP